MSAVRFRAAAVRAIALAWTTFLSMSGDPLQSWHRFSGFKAARICLTATLMPWYYLAQTLSLISTRKETYVKCSKAVCILLLSLAVPSLQAADLKTEEAAIRAAIASGQAKVTD